MTSTDGFLGIDFGTSSSYFAWAWAHKGNTPQILCLDPNEEAIPTFILFRKTGSGEVVVEIGQSAQTEFDYRRREPDGYSYRFSANFKPDILVDEVARADARAFLKACFDRIIEAKPDLGDPAFWTVAIGVPAEIPEEQRELTRALAIDAGFRNVLAIPEPHGALAWHLERGDVTVADASKGVVVVDFGGGTLDLAYMSKQKLHRPHGNSRLGGRLFDDLFFTWLCDTDASFRRVVNQGEFDRSLLLGYECRKLKEKFSNHWSHRLAKQQPVNFRGAISLNDDIVHFRDATDQHFLERARKYRPSRVFLEMYPDIQRDQLFSESLAKNGYVDLVSWINHTVWSWWRDLCVASPSKVILTGGSSSWPFIKDIAKSIFGEGTSLAFSQFPGRVIGEGLSLYLPRRQNLAVSRNRLRDELEQKLKEIEEGVASRFRDGSRTIARDISKTVTDQVVPAFLAWRLEGGKLEDIEHRCAQILGSVECDAQVRAMAAKGSENLEITISAWVNDVLREWLKVHGHDIEDERHVVESSVDIFSGGDFEGVIGKISEDVDNNVSLALAVVFGSMGASIAGGSGIALIASGPIGLIVGFLASLPLIFWGKDALIGHGKSINIPGAVTRLVPESYVMKCVLESAKELEETIYNNMEPRLDGVLKDIVRRVEVSVKETLASLEIFE